MSRRPVSSVFKVAGKQVSNQGNQWLMVGIQKPQSVPHTYVKLEAENTW